MADSRIGWFLHSFDIHKKQVLSDIVYKKWYLYLYTTTYLKRYTSII